jgi:hypothetical protein
MSKMSNYAMEIEETFWDSVSAIIKDSKNVEEALERAISLAKPVVPNLEEHEISEGVHCLWHDATSDSLTQSA